MNHRVNICVLSLLGTLGLTASGCGSDVPFTGPDGEAGSGGASAGAGGGVGASVGGAATGGTAGGGAGHAGKQATAGSAGVSGTGGDSGGHAGTGGMSHAGSGGVAGSSAGGAAGSAGHGGKAGSGGHQGGAGGASIGGNGGAANAGAAGEGGSAGDSGAGGGAGAGGEAGSQGIGGDGGSSGTGGMGGGGGTGPMCPASVANGATCDGSLASVTCNDSCDGPCDCTASPNGTHVWVCSPPSVGDPCMGAKACGYPKGPTIQTTCSCSADAAATWKCTDETTSCPNNKPTNGGSCDGYVSGTACKYSIAATCTCQGNKTWACSGL